MNVKIEKVGYQTILMSIDGKAKCEFVFDGDEVTIEDPNGEPITDEATAENYLRLLFESADINIEVADSDEDKVEFAVK